MTADAMILSLKIWIIIGIITLAMLFIIPQMQRYNSDVDKSVSVLDKKICKYGKEIDENCSRYDSEWEMRNFEYNYNFERGDIKVKVYKKLYEYFLRQRDIYVCNKTCSSQKEVVDLIFRKKLEDIDQSFEIDKIVKQIERITEDKDKQARIAISVVQNIDYDFGEKHMVRNRYPYEVLYEKRGVCGDTTLLMITILHKLGFGVAKIEYVKQNHIAVGIKCLDKYSLNKSGYCFVETTQPSIITDDGAEYVGVGKLNSPPRIVKLYDGIGITNVEEEFEDANEIKRLRELNGQTVDKKTYDRWIMLKKKYGLVNE